MRPPRRLTNIIAAITVSSVLAVACGEPDEGDEAAEKAVAEQGLTEASAEIGPAGGVLSIEGVSISVPAGAIAAPTELTLTLAETRIPSWLERQSPTFSVAPLGLDLDAPATVEVAFDGHPGRVGLVWSNDNTTFVRRDSTVDGGVVTAEIDTLGTGLAGFERGAYPALVGDPCVGDVAVERETVGPSPGETEAETAFELDDAAVVCVEAEAMTESTDGEISVDDDSVDVVDGKFPGSPIALLARALPGEHALKVLLGEAPGNEIAVEARLTHFDTDANAGERDFIEVETPIPSTSFFSPGASDGVKDTVELAARVNVKRSVTGLSPRTELRLDSTWRVFSATKGHEVQSIDTSLDLGPLRLKFPTLGPFSANIKTTWDGTGADGAELAEGTYVIVVEVQLVHVTPGGPEITHDEAVLPSVDVTIDNTPPSVFVRRPLQTDSNAGSDGSRFIVPDETASELEISGWVFDVAREIGVEIRRDDGLASFAATSDASWGDVVRIENEAVDVFAENAFEIIAEDPAGNVQRVGFDVDVAQAFHERQISVRFKSGVSDRTIEETIVAMGARTVRAYRPSLEYLLELPAGEEMVSIQAQLSDSIDVATANLVYPIMPTSGGETTGRLVDPTLGEPSDLWYLDNSDDFVRFPREDLRCENVRSCRTRLVGTFCAPVSLDGDGTATNEPGICECDPALANSCPVLTVIGDDGTIEGESPLECLKDPVTGIHLCGTRGDARADIGFCEIDAQLDKIRTTAHAPIVAVVEQLPDLDHPDLRSRLVTNGLECCGQEVCATPCETGDQTGADGCPGYCGVDDDGDGLRDFEDPDVKALVGRLCCNGIDDDGADGIDDGCMSCNCVTWVCDGVAGEGLLAAEDDDENGYIDDARGVNLQTLEDAVGERRAQTVSPDLRFSSGHATGVAAIMAAETGNTIIGDHPEQNVTGMHPTARILPVGMYFSTAQTNEAARYARRSGADIVNFSFISPITAGSVDSLSRLIKAEREEFEQSAIDGTTLYVVAAANDALDLDPPFLERAGPEEDEILLSWAFPQELGTPFDIVVASTRNDDLFAARWAYFEPFFPEARPREFGGSPLGSNFGPETVDLAAPSDAMFVLPDDESNHTSQSAPQVAAAAAMLTSYDRLAFEKQPLRIKQRILEHGVDRAADSPRLASLQGRVATEGRLALERLLDFDPQANSLNAPRFEQATDLLPTGPTPKVTALRTLPLRTGGLPSAVLIVNGGPFERGVRPRLHALEVLRDEPFIDLLPLRRRLTLNNITYGPDDADGAFDGIPKPPIDADTGLPFVENYLDAASGDIDGDGCTDLVFAGGFDIAFPQSPCELDPPRRRECARGVPNRLLLQVAGPAGQCRGVFRDAASEFVAGKRRLPTRRDITRAVRLNDLDRDGDLDLLFASVGDLGSLFAEGADLSDQVFINNGDGVFEDATDELWPLATRVDGHRSDLAICDVNRDSRDDVLLIDDGFLVLLLSRIDVPDAVAFERATTNVPGGLASLACADVTGDSGPDPDGWPDLVLGRGSRNLLFAGSENPRGGWAGFVERSERLPDRVESTSTIEVCSTTTDGNPALFLGNLGVNRFLVWSTTDARYIDIGDPPQSPLSPESGLFLSAFDDDTTSVECANVEGDGATDLIVVGNEGRRTWLYTAH